MSTPYKDWLGNARALVQRMHPNKDLTRAQKLLPGLLALNEEERAQFIANIEDTKLRDDVVAEVNAELERRAANS